MPCGNCIELGTGVCLFGWHPLLEVPYSESSLYGFFQRYRSEGKNLVRNNSHLAIKALRQGFVLPGLGLKRHRSGSHHLFWIRTVTACIILHCRMEELVTLQYGSFTTLGEWVKQDTLRTGHSKRVAERALLGSAVLGWAQKGAPRLENCPSLGVGLFLLEHLLHNAAAMQRKEWETCKKAPSHAMSWHGQRNGPRAPLHQDPSGIHWPGDFGHGRTSVLGGVCVRPQWTPPLVTRGIHGRATSGSAPMYG